MVSHSIRCPRRGTSSDSLWARNREIPENSHPDRRITLGAALIERAAFWYQLLVLKSVFWVTVLGPRTLLETDRFTARLAL
jgi:hypothetical protein